MNGEKVICRRVSEGVYLNIPQTFNLDQIAESGQCFRMTPIQDGGYVVVNGIHVVKITPHESCGYVFHCSFDEFRDIWIPYFDFRVDYALAVLQTFRRDAVGVDFKRRANGNVHIARLNLPPAVLNRHNLP